MTILTAKTAGVKRVIACTPPIRGQIPAGTIAAMNFAGADEIYILGGVQAIAAMAVGTQTIGKVDFIAGPGNPFVAEAKRQLFGEIGIDLPAGPTEVLIVADHKANPTTIATDLLSQAEHGPDTPAVLITTSSEVGARSIEEVNRLLKVLPTKELAGVSWNDYGEVIVVDTLDDAYKLADEYAFEHVQILTENPREALQKMTSYGAIFLGEKTCVSYGDKVSNFVIWYSRLLITIPVHRYESCSANSESCSIHRWIMGRQIPQDCYVPRSHIREGEWRVGKTLWSCCSS